MQAIPATPTVAPQPAPAPHPLLELTRITKVFQTDDVETRAVPTARQPRHPVVIVARR